MNRNQRGEQPLFSLAGWLFADLFLGLAMIFLVSNYINIPLSLLIYQRQDSEKVTVSYPIIDSSTTPTRIIETSIIPTQTPTIRPDNKLISSTQMPGLQQDPKCYYLTLDNNIINPDKLIRELKAQIPNSSNSQAGLVLTWANGGSLESGVKQAREVNQIINRNFQVSFNQAITKSLYLGSIEKGKVVLEIYFFNNRTWESGYEDTCPYLDRIH